MSCETPKNADAERTTIHKEFARDPLQITISISPAKPTLMDRIILKLRVVVAPEYQVRFPELGKKLPQFDTYAFYQNPLTIENNLHVHEQVHELEALISGKTTIPAMEFHYSKGKKLDLKTAKVARTEKFALEISSGVPVDQNLQKLYDIRNVVKLPSRKPPWLILSIGCLGLLAGSGLLLWRLKKNDNLPSVPKIDPQEVAWESLNRLMNSDYLTCGHYKLFYFELTRIVRQYIEDVYRIKAPRQTTEEFLRNLAHANSFPRQKRQILQQFLQRADMVKYAAQTPGKEEIENVFTIAKEIIGLQ